MNRKDMRKLITDTLTSIDHFYDITKSDVNLIEMTFLMESDMNKIFSDGSIDKRGMFMVTKSKLEEIVMTIIKPSKKAKQNIMEISLVDIDSDSLNDMFEASAYNFAFQILVLFYFYFTKLPDMPIDLTQCANAYYNVWKGCGNVGGVQKNSAIKTFIEYDKEVKK